jgi:osmoprotectant transport system permease protein
MQGVMIMSESKALKKSASWTEWIEPVIIVLVAVVWGWWVINYPSDETVARYINTEKLLQALWRHVYIIFISAGLAVCTSVPLGLILTRPAFKRISNFIVSIVSIFQTIPSFAVVAIMFSLLGIGAKTAICALWLYSLFPILLNTIAGIRGVDTAVVDAARGMGMTKVEILFKVEVPLALPVIFAGIRTAVVINVATAIIATFVGAGGLGDFIVAGKNYMRYQIMLLGAGFATLLALLLDDLLGIVEKRLVQKL